MKAIRILLGVIALLGLAVSSASAMPPGDWVSGVTVANLDTAPAAVAIHFYDSSGTEVLMYDGGVINGDSSKTWYLPSHVASLPSGFIGSAVVASDRPIAATVNTQLPSGTSPMRVGTSVGVDSPSEIVYATQLLKNAGGWNSYCAVQNTGTTPFGITARIFDAAGVERATDMQTIPSLAHHIFDLTAIPGVPDGQLSGKFESDAAHPIAVVCNFYNTGAAGSSSQFHSYNGMAEGSDTLYVPRVVKDFYGYQSGLKVQNVGTTSLTVTVTYNFGGVTYAQQSPSIGPAQSWGPYMGAPAQVPMLAGVAGAGSAVITIDSPAVGKAIIATVNEDNRVDPAGRGITYEAALPAEGTGTVVFPQITSQFYGYSSGWQVMKTSAGAVDCTATYSASGAVAAPFSDSFQLTDAIPSKSVFAPNASGMPSGMDDYNGSVTVTCPSGTIIGISNLSFRGDVDPRYPVLTGDSFTTARGINK